MTLEVYLQTCERALEPLSRERERGRGEGARQDR
jgi:hypothetical protein